MPETKLFFTLMLLIMMGCLLAMILPEKTHKYVFIACDILAGLAILVGIVGIWRHL